MTGGRIRTGFYRLRGAITSDAVLITPGTLVAVAWCYAERVALIHPDGAEYRVTLAELELAGPERIDDP